MLYYISEIALYGYIRDKNMGGLYGITPIVDDENSLVEISQNIHVDGKLGQS